jgi:hypothetical protein
MDACLYWTRNIEEYNLKTFGVKTKLFGKRERERCKKQ